MTNITIIWNEGENEVHRPDCQDVKKALSRPNAVSEDYTASDAEDLEKQVTSEAFSPEEYEDGNIVGVNIKPCVHFATVAQPTTEICRHRDGEKNRDCTAPVAQAGWTWCRSHVDQANQARKDARNAAKFFETTPRKAVGA